MDLKITVDCPKPYITRIALHGRLDTDTTPLLDDLLNGILMGKTFSVVYDLEDLEYISSAGLRAVFRTSSELEKRSGGIAVVNLQPQVQKVFTIVKGLSLSSIFKSWEEVDEFLDMMQKRVLDGEG